MKIKIDTLPNGYSVTIDGKQMLSTSMSKNCWKVCSYISDCNWVTI